MSETARMYEIHHQTERPEHFSILEKERGSLFKSSIGTQKTVLDIGCRDGTLTQWFIPGNTVIGVEIDAASARETRKKFGISVLEMDLHGDWKEISGKTFDVIVAGEVLEHLFYPQHIMEKVRAHLSGEGLFIGSVPNAFSLKNRIRLALGKKRGTSLQDPTHINHFSVAEVEHLLKKHFSHVHIYGLGRYT